MMHKQFHNIRKVIILHFTQASEGGKQGQRGLECTEGAEALWNVFKEKGCHHCFITLAILTRISKII